MVREMQGLIQEMRHAGARAGAVPGESPALALLDVSMVEAEAAASTCGPAESAVVAAVVSPQVGMLTASRPGDAPAAAQTQSVDLSPPTSPPSSPPRITGKLEAALLQEASDALASRSTQRRRGSAEALRPLPLISYSAAAQGRGGGHGRGRGCGCGRKD